MKLSILIPTLPERQSFLNELMQEIVYQSMPDVDVLMDSRPKPVTTGEKRNALLERATGEYVWFIDDDDMIYKGAIAAVMQGIKTGVDVLAINGVMTTDGRNPEKWFISLGNPYEKIKGVYYRFPNHITPMKREHAVKVKFPHQTFGEDYKWACALKETGLLKTQYVVTQPVYWYRVRTKK